MAAAKIEFFMAMIPPTITAQEHKVSIRNGQPVFYDPPELKAARQLLIGHLAEHRPVEALRGPVELVATWCFPTPHDRLDGQFRISKPDTDNLDKLLKDCMTRTGYWLDDAQVCREIIEKFWVKSSPAGIYVRVTSLWTQ